MESVDVFNDDMAGYGDSGDRIREGWSTRPPGEPSPPEKPPSIQGNTIWLGCEYTVTLPLWDVDGPVHDDPEWVRCELGLSPELIDDLIVWAEEWERVNSAAVSDDSRRAHRLPWGWSRRHRRDGYELLRRLRQEIRPEFDVFSAR